MSDEKRASFCSYATLESFFVWARRWALGDRTTLSDHVQLYLILGLVTANLDFSVSQGALRGEKSPPWCFPWCTRGICRWPAATANPAAGGVTVTRQTNDLHAHRNRFRACPTPYFADPHHVHGLGSAGANPR